MLSLKVYFLLQVVVGVSVLDNHHRRLLAAPGADKYGNQDTSPVCLSKKPALCQDSGGYSNHNEAAGLALVNWARIDPDDYKTQNRNGGEYSCTDHIAKMHPLYWDSGLNQASRQSSWILTQDGCPFQHDTCSKFCSLYGGECGTQTRLAAYNPIAPRWYRENIAAGQRSALRVTNAWLGSKGHCIAIFGTGHTRMGVGYTYSASTRSKHWWAQTFSRGPTPYSGLKIASGSHITLLGTTRTKYFVSYYGSANPSKTVLVLQGQEKTLVSTGSDKAKATYHIELTSPTECQNYHFKVVESDGTELRHPADPTTDFVTYGTGGCSEPKIHPTGNAGGAKSTKLPTKRPTTKQPTKFPTKTPTTKQPTKFPTKTPTTKQTTKFPTKRPTTKLPTNFPTKRPTTKQSTKFPTKRPTTKQSTKFPTKRPTTKQPTKFPTKRPTSCTGKDTHKKCASWARKGKCGKKSVKFRCYQSCCGSNNNNNNNNACSGPDTHKKCSKWKKKGECSFTSVKESCPQSCCSVSVSTQSARHGFPPEDQEDIDNGIGWLDNDADDEDSSSAPSTPSEKGDSDEGVVLSGAVTGAEPALRMVLSTAAVVVTLLFVAM